MTQKALLFSERYQLKENILKNYGAADINFLTDRPLFIDPMLIFHSDKKEYKQLHSQIVKYLKFLFSKCNDRKPTRAEIKTWFSFNEVKENWLGYSRKGNEGRGLNKPFGEFLAEHLNLVLETHNITKGTHLEKISLLDSRVGKDKISDFTTNLIKGFLAEYTQTFVIKNLNETDYEEFPVDKADFDYKTQTFVTKRYKLPFVIKKKHGVEKKEYILLTPIDILREEEQSINYHDMVRSQYNICRTIDDAVLRTNIERFISVEIDIYKQECIRNKKKIKDKELSKIEKSAFESMLMKHPEILDYYIKFKENNPENDILIADKERQYNDLFYSINAKALAELLRTSFIANPTIIDAGEEAKYRIIEFKRIMEVDGYKYCYDCDGNFVKKEPELQMMFSLALIGSIFNTDKEVNNGTGPVDFKISFGKIISQLIEFKLASNSKLANVFRQTASYEKANNTGQPPFVVVFYSSDKEFEKVNKILQENKVSGNINESIFLINCKKKLSASNE